MGDATIADVAKAAKVSSMTVTRVFNQSGPVAAKTRERIMRKATELDYRPNFLARGLRGGKTRSVGILWSLAGPHPSTSVVREISTRLHRRGYLAYIADSLSDPSLMTSVLYDYATRRVDGLIVLLNESLAADKRIADALRKFASVVLVSPIEFVTDYDLIVRDPLSPLGELIGFWSETDRRRIVFVGTESSMRSRWERIKSLLKKHGSPANLDVKITIDVDKRNLTGDEYVEGLLEKFPDPSSFDAVWCSTDEGAAAVMNHLRSIGVNVPEDVAVAGANNHSLGLRLSPPLATIDRRDDKVSEAAANMLLERLDGETGPPRREFFPMRFVHRLSAGVISEQPKEA